MPGIDRDNIPKAASFDLCECGDPDCGPHIVACDAAGRPMVEIVISRPGTLTLIGQLQGMLYRKAAHDD